MAYASPSIVLIYVCRGGRAHTKEITQSTSVGVGHRHGDILAYIVRAHKIYMGFSDRPKLLMNLSNAQRLYEANLCM